MIHMLVMLPPHDNMSDADKLAESVYVPACIWKGELKIAPNPYVGYLCLGHTNDPSVVDCPECRPYVEQFLTDFPSYDPDKAAMSYAYGSVVGVNLQKV